MMRLGSPDPFVIVSLPADRAREDDGYGHDLVSLPFFALAMFDLVIVSLGIVV